MRTERKGRVLWVMGLLTLLVFGVGGAWLVHQVQGRALWPVVLGEGPWWPQVGAGIGAGLLLGRAAWALAASPLVRPATMRYVGRIGPLVGRPADRLFISLCAGVGEELFFRGAVQFWAGVPATAVLFVAVHGYLDPRNWRLCIYGLALTAAMVLLGLWADRAGLLGPMAAHAALDVVLLQRMHRAWKQGAGGDQACG
ncbi:MAG: CPBP family intramembrane glutamic endopeptidase [Flavobacteriales bacterium]|jgi:hypothetical protein|nr:CPBP family intramembrane glutamic endopeptidase [Flavobacteriales bacterium]